MSASSQLISGDAGAQRYIASLDGLRAFCAFAVILVHTAPSVFPNGSIGVDVFFVLSGFLITRLLLREYRSRGSVDLARFYIGRSARLWPAVLTLIAAWCAVAVVFWDPSAVKEQLSAGLWSGLYVMNWVRALTHWPQGSFGHTWSLAIEEQFYLLWPLILSFLLRQKLAPLGSGVLMLIVGIVAWRAGLAFTGASPERLYNGFDTRADSLLVGCLLGTAPEAARVFRLARRSWPLPAALLLLATLLPHAESAFNICWTLVVIAGLSAWLIAGLTVASSAPVLSHPWAVYLGKISYGVYLWHYPISLQAIGHFHLTPLTAPLVVTGLSVICAAGSYHLIELPIRRQANAWIDRRRAMMEARAKMA